MAEKTIQERVAALEAGAKNTSGALVKINTLAQKLDEEGSLDALASLNERLDSLGQRVVGLDADLPESLVDRIQRLERMEEEFINHMSHLSPRESVLCERLDEVEAWLGPKLQGNWQGSNAMTQEWLQKLELASRGQLEKHDRRLKVVEARAAQVAESLSVLLETKQQVIGALMTRFTTLEEDVKGLSENMRERVAEETERQLGNKAIISQEAWNENQRVHNELRNRAVREESQRSRDVGRLEGVIARHSGELDRVRENHDSLSREVTHAEEDRERLRMALRRAVKERPRCVDCGTPIKPGKARCSACAVTPDDSSPKAADDGDGTYNEGQVLTYTEDANKLWAGLKPLDYDCECCRADPGVPCAGTLGQSFHAERWQAAWIAKRTDFTLVDSHGRPREAPPPPPLTTVSKAMPEFPPPPPPGPKQSFSQVHSVSLVVGAWVREASAIAQVLGGMDPGMLADDIDELCLRWVRERGVLPAWRCNACGVEDRLPTCHKCTNHGDIT